MKVWTYKMFSAWSLNVKVWGAKVVYPSATYVRLVNLEAVIPISNSGYKVLEESICYVCTGHENDMRPILTI